MTKEKILAMKPGRELDVLVAKKIFRIEVEWDYRVGDINHVLPKLPYLKGKPRMVLGPMAHSVSNTIYEYSTEISAAWQVVENLFTDGFHIIIMTVYIHNTEPKYKVLVQQILRIGTPKDCEVEADSAPEAICKAALIAKHSGKNTCEGINK